MPDAIRPKPVAIPSPATQTSAPDRTKAATTPAVEQPEPAKGWQAKSPIARKLDGWAQSATDPHTFASATLGAMTTLFVGGILGSAGAVMGGVFGPGGVALGVAAGGAVTEGTRRLNRAVDSEEIKDLAKRAKLLLSNGASSTAWLPTSQAVKDDALAVLMAAYQGSMPRPDGTSIKLELNEQARAALATEINDLKAARV